MVLQVNNVTNTGNFGREKRWFDQPRKQYKNWNEGTKFEKKERS